MAEFQWYLNRQGPRGPQGPQGPQGFSPVITVEEDSLNAYILRIRTQDSEFLTSNLRGSIEDLGGTYVRYNRETGQLYAGSADNATTTQYGMVRFATDEEVEAGDYGVVIDANNLQEATESLQNSINSLSSDINNIKDNYVTTNTIQTITEQKDFINGLVTSRIVSNTSNKRIVFDRIGALLIDGGEYGVTIRGELYNGDYRVLTTRDTYKLPIASSTTLGGVKIGENLSISEDGTLSAITGMTPTDLVTWLTENKEQVLQILGLDPIDGGDSTTV